MSTEEKSQISEEQQQISLEETQETSSESSPQTLLQGPEAQAEITSESPGCDGSDSHKWANKMEVQRHLSGKPDLEIQNAPEATGWVEQAKPPVKEKNRPEDPDKENPYGLWFSRAKHYLQAVCGFFTRYKNPRGMEGEKKAS